MKPLDEIFAMPSCKNSEEVRIETKEEKTRRQRDRSNELTASDAETAKGYRMPRDRDDKLTVRARKECARIREKITAKDHARLKGTSLDRHAEFAALSLFDKKDRAALIDRAASGQSVSAVTVRGAHKAKQSYAKTEEGKLVSILESTNDDMLARALFKLSDDKRQALRAEMQRLSDKAPAHLSGKQRRLDEARENEKRIVHALIVAREETVDALCAFESVATVRETMREAVSNSDADGTELLAQYGFDEFGFDQYGRPFASATDAAALLTGSTDPSHSPVSMLDTGPATAAQNLRILMDSIKLGDGKQVMGMSHETRGKAVPTNHLWSLSDADVKFFYRSIPGEFRNAA